MRIKKISSFYILFIILILALPHCGGSALPQASLPAPSIVEGTVTSPTPESSSINNLSLITPGRGGRSVIDVAASNITCNIYTLEGEDLGEFTTEADGTFSLSVNTTTLKGSEDTEASWDEGIIINCTNGMQLYANITSTALAASSTVNVGTVNSSATLAAQAFALNITNWNEWGEDYSGSKDNQDHVCANDSFKSLWDNVSVSGTGLADDNFVIKEVLSCYMAQGGTPSIGSYTSWQGLIQGVLNGTLETDVWSAMVTTATSCLDTSTAIDFANGYSNAYAAFASLEEVLNTQFAPNGWGVGDLPMQDSQTIEGNLCDNIKSDTLNADALVKPMLVSDDVTTFNTIYGDAEGIGVHFALLQQCLEDDNCNSLIEKPDAYYGYLANYGGDFSDVIDANNTFDTTTINGIILAADNCTGATPQDIQQCGSGMYETLQQADCGFDNLLDSEGNLDTELFKILGGVWVEQIGDNANPNNMNADNFNNVCAAFKAGFLEGDQDQRDQTRECIEAHESQGIFDNSACFPNDYGFEGVNRP